MTSAPSILLADCVLDSLAEGRPVTARSVARRWGADRVRVLEYLLAYKALGLCRAKTVKPRRRSHRPYLIFVPRPARVRAHRRAA